MIRHFKKWTPVTIVLFVGGWFIFFHHTSRELGTLRHDYISVTDGQDNIPAPSTTTSLPAERSSTGLPAETSSTGLPAETSITGMPAKRSSTGLPEERSSTGLAAEKNGTKSGWLTVLYWTDWFQEPWSRHFGDESRLQEMGCPEFRCNFTYDQTSLKKADFVFFTSSFNKHNLPYKKGSTRQQHWVYSLDESPAVRLITSKESVFFDWIQSYNTGADVPGYNGYFVPINRTSWPDGSNMMDPKSEVYLSYIKALNEGKSLDDLIDTVPPDYRERLVKLIGTFESKRKLGAFMTGHCETDSKRLSVIKNLIPYLKNNTVSVYGQCTGLPCKKRHPTDPWCWQNLLAPNYFFYFSMENTLCEQYITEKLYNPLLHGLVPVVYGGANYSLYLPPHSYIDVQQHTPQQLADLLRRISEDKEEYSRYHLWRAFWEPVVGGNVCATCRALHRLKKKVPRPRENIDLERRIQEPCHPPDSPDWFPE